MDEIIINHLTYTYKNGTKGLNDVNASLPKCSRTLLVGGNGAGKTTLLRLLAGKSLTRDGSIVVGGVDPFKEGLEGVTYLGTEWVLNPVVRNTDVGVVELIDGVGGVHFPERKAELMSILDIDPRWKMHTVSDGERRRVQLAMGLVRPWTVLLLDEVTVDLDCLARARFLAWLKAETEKRPATVVYASHILDGLLESWPTHLIRMDRGKFKASGPVADFFANETRTAEECVLKPEENHPETFQFSGNSALLKLALKWLSEDLAERGPRC